MTATELCFRIAAAGVNYDTEDLMDLTSRLRRDNPYVDPEDALLRLGWKWEQTPDGLWRLAAVTAEECDQPYIVEVRK